MKRKTHKADGKYGMLDLAVCGYRPLAFRYSGIPTRMRSRWESVTCERCLARNRTRRVATRRMLNTRAVYAFERDMQGPERPMAVLRRFARAVWAREGRGKPFPAMVAGRGTPHCGRLVSYCLGARRIVLARVERDYITVLHELTHALGPEQHGKAFQRLYARLIGRYWR